LGQAVETRALMGYLKERIVMLEYGGSASAMWYLWTKNAVIRSGHHPKTIVIFFRDQFLTEPTFRVEGERYRTYIDQLSMPEEPLLDRLSYHASLDNTEYFLQSTWSLYQKRKGMKKIAENQAKLFSGKITGNELEEINAAIERKFADENMSEELLTKAQLAAESNTDYSRYDFKELLPKSFLPEIVRLTRENNIQLILVRVKRRRDLTPGGEPEVIRQYISDLTQYLKENDVALIDYTYDERIMEKHYGAGDHINLGEGRQLFTRIFADDLRPLLKRSAAN
jgi:hypothetical protein